MADVFLTYSRHDRADVEPVAQALSSVGLTAWWDQELRPGEDYGRVMARELDQARIVVVFWSEASTQSHWVREHAREGMSRNALFPVRLDDSVPPLAFRRLQTFELRDAGQIPELLQQLVRFVADRGGPTPTTDTGAESTERRSRLERIRSPKRSGITPVAGTRGRPTDDARAVPLQIALDAAQAETVAARKELSLARSQLEDAKARVDQLTGDLALSESQRTDSERALAELQLEMDARRGLTRDVFLNYRRDDSRQMTERIADWLIRDLGSDSIFIDVDSIPSGVDYREHLSDQVQGCSVCHRGTVGHHRGRGRQRSPSGHRGLRPH